MKRITQLQKKILLQMAEYEKEKHISGHTYKVRKLINFSMEQSYFDEYDFIDALYSMARDGVLVQHCRNVGGWWDEDGSVRGARPEYDEVALTKEAYMRIRRWKSFKVTTGLWIVDINNWCPAQIYYYFKDAADNNWCIYLRWRHENPWTAELVSCSKQWDFIWDSPDNENLLEEKEHTPGILTGYYKDEEYDLLMGIALEQVRKRFPDCVFHNNQQMCIS